MYPSSERRIQSMVERFRPDDLVDRSAHINLIRLCAEFIECDLNCISLDDPTDRTVATLLLTKFIEEISGEQIRQTPSGTLSTRRY